MTEIEIQAEVYRVIRANQGLPKRALLKLLNDIEGISSKEITKALLNLLEASGYK